MGDNFMVCNPSQSNTVMEEPTPRLRWLVVVGMGRTLQQWWSITKYGPGGFVTDGTGEWRDVPSEN